MKTIKGTLRSLRDVNNQTTGERAFRRKTFRDVLNSGAWGAIILFITTISAFSQSTNGPVLSIVKVRADQPAVLQWTSNTNEFYRIDYASDLTSNFTTAAEYIPNQGTNTVWADSGTESAFYPRTTSADVGIPYRFYRIAVQGYSSNDFPAVITISNAASTLSGFTNIFASVTSPSNVISGSLLVDGTKCRSAPGLITPFQWKTRLFPNGTHRLTVSVENDGDAGTTGGDDPVPDPASDGEAAYAANNAPVVFSNFLSDVHLKYSGYRPDLGQTQEVHAVWGSPRSWQVDITSADDTNTVYRSFTGSGTAVSVIWDGLDSNGQDLSPQRIAYVIYDLGQARNEHEPTHSFRRSDFRTRWSFGRSLQMVQGTPCRSLSTRPVSIPMGLRFLRPLGLRRTRNAFR